MLGAPLRLIARAALAAMFIKGGYDAATAPGGRVLAAERVGLPAPDLMVRANGATMVLAGSALALGVRSRLAALALLGTLGPTTYAGHPFWSTEDPAMRQQHLTQFLKNVGMAGGLLLVVAQPARSGSRPDPD